MAHEPPIQWPSDPSFYEWKGTLSQASNVWSVLAHCKAVKTDVIIEIKQYQRNDEDSLEAIEAFSNRLKTLIHMNHEHLLTPIHSFFFKNEVWTIYPRHSGGVLQDLLTSHYPNGVHDEQLISYLLCNVVEGLIYLHKNQSCHRNINPSCIYFDKDLGIVLLSEFAELKEIKFTKQYNHSESIISSTREPWTDPLLLIKHPDASWYDGDIYSVGITALHLVFGSAPVHAENFTNELLRLVADPKANDSDLYDKIGIESYAGKQCMIKSKAFMSFINDCTSAAGKRPAADKLRQHTFFAKKNMYDVDTVKSKIGHLFQSTEARINAAFSAPLSFPNVVASVHNLKDLVLNDNNTFNENQEIVQMNNTEEKVTDETDETWTFSPRISETKKPRFDTFVSDDEEPLKQDKNPKQRSKSDTSAGSESKGRFTVQGTRTGSVTFSTVVSTNSTDPQKWDTEECGDWVAAFGDAYKPYKKVFVDNGIDGEMLLHLTDELLTEIIPSKLHRTKIISSAKKVFN